MKAIKTLAIAAIAIMATATASQAQILSIGPRIGTEINRLSFDKNTFSPDNRAGFTAGLQAEVSLPVVGLGFDISAMYVHRSSASTLKLGGAPAGVDVTTYKGDYIEIPINFKYKIGLPGLSKILAPYIFTGPSIAFLASKQDAASVLEKKKCDVAWNFGVGVQLFQHLQIGASYGLGITKAVKYTGLVQDAAGIDGKNNYWTVTAAWLFKVL